MVLPMHGSRHPIPPYYSFIDPEKMKSCVGSTWLLMSVLVSRQFAMLHCYDKNTGYWCWLAGSHLVCSFVTWMILKCNELCLIITWNLSQLIDSWKNLSAKWLSGTDVSEMTMFMSSEPWSLNTASVSVSVLLCISCIGSRCCYQW